MNNQLMIVLTVVFLLGLIPAQANADSESTFQYANMHEFGTGIDVAGGGTLGRSDDAVWVRLATSGLDKKAAYTVWWVVFNYPDACSDPCNGDDLGDAAVAPGAFYATGFVTGSNGTANVTAHLDAGDLPIGVDELLGTGQGLESGNGLGAEIHLIVRSHGKSIAGAVGSQISTFAGECGVAPDYPNCDDQQAIAFLPMMN